MKSIIKLNFLQYTNFKIYRLHKRVWFLASSRLFYFQKLSLMFQCLCGLVANLIDGLWKPRTLGLKTFVFIFSRDRSFELLNPIFYFILFGENVFHEQVFFPENASKILVNKAFMLQFFVPCSTTKYLYYWKKIKLWQNKKSAWQSTLLFIKGICNLLFTLALWHKVDIFVSNVEYWCMFNPRTLIDLADF